MSSSVSRSKAWLLPNILLLTYLSYISVQAWLSPDHITYFFWVLGKPFYAITLSGGLWVIAALLFTIHFRGLREAPFIVGFTLALYDSSNGLIDWNGTHWGLPFLIAIALVYAVLYLAPYVVGGFKFNLGTKALLYYLIISLIWNGVIFPPIYATYSGEFTLYLIGEPIMLSLALFASAKILMSNPSSARL